VANGLPVLACNRVGYEPAPQTAPSKHPVEGINFWGGSFVAGPQGEILGQCSSHQDETLVIDLDLTHTEKIRQSWPFLRDRRIDAYGNINQRVID